MYLAKPTLFLFALRGNWKARHERKAYFFFLTLNLVVCVLTVKALVC